MPELPEVQTIVNDLQKIVGDQITGFFSKFPKALKNTTPKKFSDLISGKKIISIERIGKNILITLEKNIVIGIHLKMTGKLIISEQRTANNEQEKKFLHHIFYLKARSQKLEALEFHDIRKFGTITLHDSANFLKIKSKFGIDPLDNSSTLASFSSAISRKPNKKIKEVLMDQTVVSGIGNIYASEILFVAGILPMRDTKTISEAEKKKLFSATKKVLKKAIKWRGTSVSDYRDASGKKGQFQNHLLVYKKDTQKCKKCGTIIRKIILGQRSSFYCPKCQR